MTYTTKMILGHLAVVIALIVASAIIGAAMLATGMIDPVAVGDTANASQFSVACHTFDTVGHTLPTSCE